LATCATIGGDPIRADPLEGYLMIQIKEDLAQRIQTLEKELQIALEEKERAFRYNLHQGEGKIRRRGTFSAPQA
jgi:hypothetical protein